jgi:RNA polymerase sigma-70 factor, ECF subfamily
MNADYADTLRLIVRAQSGDATAAEQLVHTYHPLIYRLAVSMLDDPAEADEATQEALISAVDRLDSFRGEASFSTWLYAIALNECRGRLRKRRARERLAQVLHALFRVDLSPPSPVESTVIEQQENTALWQAVQALPDKQREVIMLRYYSELKIVEIARVLGITDRAVRARLRTANDRLRAVLKNEVERP